MDINNSLALQVQQPDITKTLGTISTLQQAQAHTGLYQLQAEQQRRQLAVHDMLKSGDIQGALTADPGIAKAYLEGRQLDKTQNTLATYGDAASRGDPDAVGKIASVSPEEVFRIAQTRNTMKEADRKQFDLSHDAVGRVASSVLQMPPGPERDQYYQEQLKGLLKSGAITPEMYQRGAQQTLSDLQLNQIVRQSMAVKDARESYGNKATAEAPAKIAENFATNLGRPLPVAPNSVVTTGASAVSPTVQSGLDDAFRRLGLGNGGQPPQGGMMPGGGSIIGGGAANGAPQGSDAITPKRWPAQHGAPPPDVSGAPGLPGKPQDRVPPLPPTAPQPGPFTPKLIRSPDGSVASTANPETEKIQSGAADRFGKAAENYQTAQSLSMRLNMMDHAIADLNSSGWSSTGPGAEAKMSFANAMNSISKTLGGGDIFDPKKVGVAEDFRKESLRAGFELSRSLGSREAASVVQNAISAVPNISNSQSGAKLVSSSIRQAAQRDMDYYEFANDYARQNNGSTMGADIAFNKSHPPELYSRTAIANAYSIPMGAVKDLQSDPGKAKFFDEKFGKGLSRAFLDTGERR